MSIDLLLENGRIVDGTGAPWFRGSIGVADGMIEEVYRERKPSVRLADDAIDVDGAIICPGFVDLHSHSDLKLFEESGLEPKVRQGITTEILGQDGFSMAPMYREGGVAEWQEHLSGLAGDIDSEWTWGGIADYLDAIDKENIATNLAVLVGHGTVRYNVLGMSDASPTNSELKEMANLVTEALENGAIGFSTGLVYPPQVNATTKEVATLAERLGPYGRPFVAHIRSEGRWIWEAFDEFVDIGVEKEIPLHISHFKVSGKTVLGTAGKILTLFETARDRGVDLTADKYPYAAGNTMLTAALPPWVHADGAKQLEEYLRSDEARDRMHRDIEEWRIDGWENNAGKTGWENIVVTNIESKGLKEVEGETVADIAAEWDSRPIDVVCDILVEDGTSVSMVTHSQSETDVREMLANERVAIGTDGLFGGNPHPRTYGTYPRILGHYVRDEHLFTLEEAIRKMTSLPARAMGLNSKGIIRPRMDADLVVFRPEVVSARATYDSPQQYPIGMPYVIVNGKFVIRNGDTTSSLPGQAIRA